MKSSIFLLLFSILVLNSLQSQVLEETRSMSTGSKPALTVIIPDADSKFIEAEWKEYMKSYGKVTKVKSSKELVASDIQILDIGGVNRLNVHSLSEETADGTKMVVWFDMGSGFISSEAYPKEYVAGVKFLKDFSAKVKLDMVTQELEEQQKALTKAESNLTKLQRENDNYHRIIEDAKKRIAEAEQDIEKNLKDQEQAHKEIEAQKEVVGGVQQKLEECKKQ
ncbi:MAG TPA: hypothetical protein VMZ69_05700 [Saprospiraceae bacterium]|nr:hypothetical protein [Saprospiraceae bacterium]